MPSKRSDDERLGMFRAITRRDFLQGTALALAAPGLVRAQGQAHPPSGFEGQDDPSTECGHRVRDGIYQTLPSEIVDTGEDYDLIVVAASLAGLASAYVYQKERGGEAKVLLLENNDNFGGHARRNTFRWKNTTLIVNGGTYDLEAPERAPAEAAEIFDDVGITAERLVAFRDPDYRKRFGLSSTAFFDSRIYPGIRPQFVHGFHDIPWEEFFAKSPLSEEVKRELVTLYTTRKNYLPGVEEPYRALASMTWEEYIRDKMGLGDNAVRFSDIYATDLGGLGCDGLAGTYGWELGPGFFGVHGEGFYDDNGFMRYGYQPIHRFPDGNHSVARHLLKKLTPNAIDGPDTVEGVFDGQIHPDRFDTAGSNVRLRLQSTVIQVKELDGGSRGEILSAAPDGSVHSVKARGAIVAAWGMAAKHIVPDIPDAQRKALGQYNYAAALYINVMLRQWRPIAEAGAFEMYLPGGYCMWMHPLDPLHVGDYRPEHHPDKPTILSMFKYLRTPGLPPEDQMKLARYELEKKPFEDFEREIRSELEHILGPWGFDPAKDILAITVNRWGHGYIVFPHASVDAPPQEAGRERVGRVSFAGADAGGEPWTQAALQQAHRAAHEQLELG